MDRCFKSTASSCERNLASFHQSVSHTHTLQSADRTIRGDKALPSVRPPAQTSTFTRPELLGVGISSRSFDGTADPSDKLGDPLRGLAAAAEVGSAPSGPVSPLLHLRAPWRSVLAPFVALRPDGIRAGRDERLPSR